VRRGFGAAVLDRHRCAAKLDAKAASRGFLLLHKGKKKEGGRAELLLGHGDVVGEGAGLREKRWDSKGAEEVGVGRTWTARTAGEEVDGYWLRETVRKKKGACASAHRSEGRQGRSVLGVGDLLLL
jgi:hypothetical protein